MILYVKCQAEKHWLGDSEDMTFVNIKGLLRHSRSLSISHCLETRQLTGLLKPKFPKYD